MIVPLMPLLQVVGRVKAPETDADVKLFYQYMDQIEAAE